jgi:ectoine hydroxylase-related dioxygenase (phytanoyl-CoA dioxygenase family)
MRHFIDNGWMVIDFADPGPVCAAREALQRHLAHLLQKNISLEEYHLEAQDDAFHTEIQVRMTQFFREQKWALRIFERQVEFLRRFIGLDILVQANPYLRMARPFKKQDNIGYHRDTFYGGSPYEVSVFIPFVDLEKESSLSVLSGTHVDPESKFPTTPTVDPVVSKGSEKHGLGFLYAPKLMDPSIEEKMRAIPLKVGQALLFSLSTVHGSVENRGATTRWSTDARILHALAPVDLSARPHYYETLELSPVTTCAKLYHARN